MNNTPSKDLVDLKFQDFLENGFVFQSPNKSHVWLGVLEEGSPRDYIICHQNFYSSKKLYFNSQKLYKVSTAEFTSYIQSHFVDHTSLLVIENSDDNYSKDVADCLNWIASDSKLKKLVAVTRAKYKSLNNIHPISRFRELDRLAGQFYGFWQESGSGMIGCSPEILFNKKGSVFSTTALAGTISTAEEGFDLKLLGDPKEKQEHNLVITGIHESLAHIAKNLETDKTTVTVFGELAHMRTNITFESSYSAEECIDSLHPTAALGGDPKELSLEYLQKLRYFKYEQQERSFGGVYGLNLGDEYYSLVGIRNLYWQGSEYSIHSGSGIVAESTIEGELAEVKRKRASIAGIFCEI